MDCGLYDRVVVAGLPTGQEAYLKRMHTGFGHAKWTPELTRRHKAAGARSSPHTSIYCRLELYLLRLMLVWRTCKGTASFCFYLRPGVPSDYPSWSVDRNFVCILISSARAVCAAYLIFVDSVSLIGKVVSSMLRKGQPLCCVLRHLIFCYKILNINLLKPSGFFTYHRV
jgi:hypothetical protein